MSNIQTDIRGVPCPGCGACIKGLITPDDAEPPREGWFSTPCPLNCGTDLHIHLTQTSSGFVADTVRAEVPPTAPMYSADWSIFELDYESGEPQYEAPPGFTDIWQEPDRESRARVGLSKNVQAGRRRVSLQRVKKDHQNSLF